MNIFLPNFRNEDYIVATYYLASRSSLRNASWELAIGQSVGNPSVRSKWETEELFENHSCIIIGDEGELSKLQRGYVKVAFPLKNINLKEDGISQLLCQLMGGQMDIDDVIACHLIDIEFPNKAKAFFKGPKFGTPGIRQFTGVYDKPLLGGIVKPKVTSSPKMLLDIVKEMVDGGVNFIKEDEIMANPAVCSLKERLPPIVKYLEGKNVIYAACINGDSPYLLDRAKLVHELGGNAVHINVWSGLGAYKSVRDLDLPLFIHFQKSGDRVFTNKVHDFHIDWSVVCELAGLAGVDFIHAGMWGGYMNETEVELQQVFGILHRYKVMPALSCGMHPGLVNAITNLFGNDYLANVGGALHGHPHGTKAGAMAMRQAINGTFDSEYQIAIHKWGLVK